MNDLLNQADLTMDDVPEAERRKLEIKGLLVLRKSIADLNPRNKQTQKGVLYLINKRLDIAKNRNQ